MDQKTVCITGGGTGIGLAIAKALRTQGHHIVIMGRREEILRDAARANGFSYQVVDVSNETSVCSAFQAMPKVDILIANAGIAEGQNIRGSSLEFWRKIMTTNLDGAYLTIREGLARMPINTWGRVIAISSIAGLRGLKGAHAYTASKHGVVGLIKGLAADHVHLPVTFNAICPGYVDTDIVGRNVKTISEKTGMSAQDAHAAMVNLNPHQRLITPQEVAACAVWLCSDAASSVDGQAIEISGGPS